MTDRKLYYAKLYDHNGHFVGMTELFEDAWDCTFATKNIKSSHRAKVSNSHETSLKTIQERPSDYTKCRIVTDAEHRGHNPHDLVRQIERDGVSDWKPQSA